MSEYKQNTEKCLLGCYYWRSGGGNGDVKWGGLCHYMLDTGKRRERTADNECLSFLDRSSVAAPKEEPLCYEI